MDLKSKVQRQREDWPEGSLERQLMLDGSKSLVEAMQKRIGFVKPESKALTENEKFMGMRKIIQEVLEIVNGVDLEKIPKEKREELGKMPISSIREANLWKAAWVDAIKKIAPW